MKKVVVLSFRTLESEPMADGGNWVHGIPTAEDVTDTEYQEQRQVEWFNTRIYGATSNLTSTVWIHNRVVDGLRRYGKNVTKAEHFLEKGSMDRRVVDLVDPDFVFGVASRKLEKFTALVGKLENNKLLLDHWCAPVSVTSNVKMVFESGLINQLEEGGLFSYTYIPIEVLSGIVGKMRSQLKFISGMDGEPKLLAVWSLLKGLDSDSLLRIIRGDLEYKTGRSCFGMEHREGGEVKQMVKINREIAERSDVYVRFDAKYLVIKTPAGEWHSPFSSMFGGERTEERHALSQRVVARDLLGELAGGGEVVVNGKNLRRVDGLWKYQGSGVPTWLVNVLGESVECEVGKVDPEDWVTFEGGLVAEYRNLLTKELLKEKGINQVISDLLDRYHDADEEYGLLTLRDRLERLVYSLRRSEYDCVCR